jgi:hypothetical protein
MAKINLVNMKLSPKAREEKPSTVAADSPTYPYGLSVHLDDDTLEKLGLSSLPAVGTTKMLVAKVSVQSTSIHEGEPFGGESRKRHRNMSLQITDLGLGDDEPEGPSPAEVLYGSKD